MKTFTNNSKIIVQGNNFVIRDLREFDTMYQDDGSYFGSKKTVYLQAVYDKKDAQERKEWDEAPVLKNGDNIWIDGKLFVLVVKNLNACDGIAFITKETYDYVLNTQREIEA